MIHGPVISLPGLCECEKGHDMKKRIAVILNSEPEWGGEHQYVLTVMACLEQAEDVELWLSAAAGSGESGAGNIRLEFGILHGRCLPGRSRGSISDIPSGHGCM